MLTTPQKNLCFYLALAAFTGWVVYFIILPQKEIYDKNHVNIKGTYLIKPLPAPDFILTTNQKTTFTKANLKGRWSLVFFGFTQCNMVCPVTMHALKDIYLSLQKTLPAKQLPQVILISVDPDHDNLNTLNQYVTSFNPAFIGARTNPENTKTLEKQFHITAMKTGTTINHSSDVMLINPQAEIQAYFSFPLQTDATIQAYKVIINKSI
ncbi:MAG TPA: SCO family protein [Gammaproteobacteria bacterium]|jgi:protein SCO1/2|nr:SCO family protein [Gammaproteobacteria bacterium]